MMILRYTCFFNTAKYLLSKPGFFERKSEAHRTHRSSNIMLFWRCALQNHSISPAKLLLIVILVRLAKK